MQLSDMSAVVTGGASGLGFACARQLVERGVKVVIADRSEEGGAQAQAKLGGNSRFVMADVSNPDQMNAVMDAAEELGALRALIHCAGHGGTVRLVEKDGQPGSLETFEAIIRTNLIGTFNTLRLAAARMAKNDPVDGDRGACVLTASVAAYEGQIGQIPYASSKAGVVGMTLVAARDLAQRGIRVCSIAPGIFDTPILSRLSDEIKDALGSAVPHPRRLGKAEEFASLALHLLENPMMNGETVRLDGALRMAPR